MAANDCFLLGGLGLNVAKTKCMLVHSSQRIPTSALEVQLNGRIIDQVQRYRFLGVITTDTLSWSDHIDQVCSKASRGLNLVEISMVPPKECSLVCYYNAYVLPHLMCAAPVWSSCTKAQSTRLEGLQNFAACIILHRHGYASATLMRKELGWPTLLSRRTIGETLILHRFLSGSAPDYLSSLLKPTSSVHSHMTRSTVTFCEKVSTTLDIKIRFKQMCAFLPAFAAICTNCRLQLHVHAHYIHVYAWM